MNQSRPFSNLLNWIALVAGLLWFADLRRRNLTWMRSWVAGFLLGAGGLRLYDGTIQHKLLHLHQIRYHVTIWPYDVVWNLLAAIMILVAVLILRRDRRTKETPRDTHQLGDSQAGGLNSSGSR